MKTYQLGLIALSFLILGACTTDDVDVPAPVTTEADLYPIPDAAFGEYLMYLEIDGVEAREEGGVTQYLIDPSRVDGVSELAMSKTSSSVENLLEAGLPNAETKITNLDGIQYFVNLQVLKLTSNALTTLDLSACTKLTTLEMNFNLVGSLDLSANTALERLRYKASANAEDGQKLSSIDLSNNPGLRHLYLPRHNLTSIDLSNNSLLDDTLDLSENPGPDGDPDTPDIVVPESIFNQVPEETRAGVVSDAAVETLVSIVLGEAVIEEAGGSSTLTASLNTPSDAEVSVTLALSGTAVNQVDYVLEPSQLTIPAGETTATALLTALDDTEEEGGETVVITLSDVVGAELGSSTEVSVTINDDDFPLNLILNEILYDPWNSGLNGDANGDGAYVHAQDEFVELVNMGQAPVDLSGFEFYDTESLDQDTPAHVVAVGTVLEVGQAYVLFGGGTPTGDFGGAIVETSTSGDLNLNNSGDILTILDNNGLVVLSFDIEPLSNNPNESYTRDPDLTGDFVQHGGINGILFSPGTKTDGSSF